MTNVFDRYNAQGFVYRDHFKTHPDYEIAKNFDMFFTRRAKRDKMRGARVGDLLKLPDGTLRRFTHDWGNTIQTTCYHENEGSFYLCDTGGVSYSGGLNTGIKKTRLRRLAGKKPMPFWFFSGNFAMAGNSVQFFLPCRIFELMEE